MKVLQIINSLNTGGAEKLLLETIPLYNKRGIKVDLLVLDGKNYPFLKELKKKQCCTIYSLDKSTVYNPLLLFKIFPYFRRYDVIHVHLFPSLYWVALAKLISFAKIKLIYTEHCTENRRINNLILKTIDKKVYSFYERIVCLNEEVKRMVINQSKLPFEKLQIIENGVNLSIIKEALPLKKNQVVSSLTNRDTVLIQVAGFRTQKDQTTLIKAMVFLPQDVKLILVGDGLLREQCEILTKDLKLETRVFFLGIRTDVPQLLKTVDIVVLSTKYEGLSLSSIEGMASGKPFVASDVPGLSEIVKDAGILFEQGNEKMLATVIKELINDKKKYTEVATKCQERAEQYDISYMVDNHINLYKELYQNN